MSKLRHRVAALTLGGLLLGAPLLTNGTASAEQIETGHQVVFGGDGMFGLSCRSTPDVSSLTVPAESRVRVVNRTGHAATLRLGRDARGKLPDDASTEVVFRRGTTAVQLTPSCALGTESTPVLVTATPTPTSPSAPDPGPGTVPLPSQTTSGPPTTTPPGTTPPPATSNPPGSGAPQTGTSAPAHRPPTRTTTVTRKPAANKPIDERTVTPAAAATVPTMPQGGGAVTKVKTKFQRGTERSAPTFAGMPVGEQKTIVGGVPTVDLPSVSEAAALTPDASPSEIAAAEPVAEMRPMPESRPIGLLGVIAGVCVLGVAVAAIRAFVSERASRSFIA
ncbi:hypothetical protein [Actinoplanes sp. NPDC049265]|uniref:hypothetical protein n=1 Tax=Actinoplanes sp. NPDC049265 TaxID=3363902 RepID=UPI00371BB40E